MKIALIGDVHSNIHALKAVLKQAERHDAECVWDLGDMLGFGAFPDEVVATLRKIKALGVAGNFDKRVMKFPKKAHVWQHEKDPDKFVMLKFSYEDLSASNIKYVKSLPLTREFKAGGKKVLMVHASPESGKEHLGPDTPVERLEAIASKSGKFDMIICGHSHRPFVRKAGGTLFINPGAVGLSDDGDARASFAMLDIGSKGVKIHHYRIDYDVKAAADAVLKKGLPEIFSRMLTDALNYTAIRKRQESKEEEMESQAGRLASFHCYEEAHARQVMKISEKIFDSLEGLHGMSSHDRAVLKCAALLHDIGIADGNGAHHKMSMEMILKGSLPGFTDTEKLMTALIARYHRKALPAAAHVPYSTLGPGDRRKVNELSAILRVADGLDRTHSNAVSDVSCEVTPEKITLKCITMRPAQEELRYGLIKSDLMKKVFGREIEVR